jgi:hypothetical protein
MAKRNVTRVRNLLGICVLVVIGIAACGTRIRKIPTQATSPTPTITAQNTFVPTATPGSLTPAGGHIAPPSVGFEMLEVKPLAQPGRVELETIILPAIPSGGVPLPPQYVGNNTEPLEDLDIPIGTFVNSSPCGVGTKMPKTGSGNDFHAGHPGFDGYCPASENNEGNIIKATANAMVLALYDDRWNGTEGYDPRGINGWMNGYSGYGRAYVLVTQVSVEELRRNGIEVDVEGEYTYLFHTYGHLVPPPNVAPTPRTEDYYPLKGDIVKAGDVLGSLNGQWVVGKSTGPHLHYTLYVKTSDGYIQAINPKIYGGAYYPG